MWTYEESPTNTWRHKANIKNENTCLWIVWKPSSISISILHLKKINLSKDFLLKSLSLKKPLNFCDCPRLYSTNNYTTQNAQMWNLRHYVSWPYTHKKNRSTKSACLPAFVCVWHHQNHPTVLPFFLCLHARVCIYVYMYTRYVNEGRYWVYLCMQIYVGRLYTSTLWYTF